MHPFGAWKATLLSSPSATFRTRQQAFILCIFIQKQLKHRKPRTYAIFTQFYKILSISHLESRKIQAMCFSRKAESTANIHFSAPAPHLFSFHNPRHKHLVSYRNTQTGQTKRQNAITCKKAEKTNTHAFTRRIILRPSVFYALTSGTYSENC